MFCTRRQVACKMFISKAFRRPCQKYYISGYLGHKSFIQMIKCSLLNQIIIYHSFHGVLLTFSYSFYFKEKFCVSARVGEMFVLKRLSKKIISPVLLDTARSFKW